jgi:hypothetical protein
MKECFLDLLRLWFRNTERGRVRMRFDLQYNIKGTCSYNGIPEFGLRFKIIYYSKFLNYDLN